MLRRVIWLAAVLVLLASCASTKSDMAVLTTTSGPQTTGATAATTAQPAPGAGQTAGTTGNTATNPNDAVVKITFPAGGTDYVTRAEFEQFRDKIARGISEEEALNELTTRHLLLHEALVKDLTPDPTETEKAFTNIQDRVCTNPQFQAELPAEAQAALAADQSKLLDLCAQFFGFADSRALRAYLGEEQVIDQVTRSVVTPGEEVRAAHILLQVQPTPQPGESPEAATQRTFDERKIEIDQIYNDLKSDPTKFEAVANEKTEDPSGKGKGGDLGFFGPGAMVPEFEQAAFTLKDGEISEPIKTQFGWHIVKRIEARQGTELSRDAVVAYRTKLLSDAKAAGQVEFLITPAAPPTPEPPIQLPTAQTAPEGTTTP